MSILPIRIRHPRRAHTALTLLGLLGAAHAGVLHLPLTMSPAALLQPDTAALRAACDTGLDLALSGSAIPTVLDGRPTLLTLGDGATPTVTLLTAPGSMLGRCYRVSMDSRAVLDAQRTATGTVWVTVRGDTQTAIRDEAQGWRVHLSVQDTSGRELARIEPTLISAGRSEQWTSTCQAQTCVWTGENRYGFDLGQVPATVLASAHSAARVTVEVEMPTPVVMAGLP